MKHDLHKVHALFCSLSFFFSVGVLVQEGSSQARYFVSRLIPAHKDPTYEQVMILLTLAVTFWFACIHPCWVISLMVLTAARFTVTDKQNREQGCNC